MNCVTHCTSSTLTFEQHFEQSTKSGRKIILESHLYGRYRHIFKMIYFETIQFNRYSDSIDKYVYKLDPISLVS